MSKNATTRNRLELLHVPVGIALLVLLPLALVLAAVPQPGPGIQLCKMIAALGLVVAAIVATGSDRRRLLIGSVLGAVYVVMLVMERLNPSGYPLLLGVSTLFMWYIIILLGLDVLGQRHTRVRNLVAAANLYLFSALAFVRVYFMIHDLNPEAFRVPEGDVLEESTITYFSFITQTTLGYGDITPASGVARAVAGVQATFGVLYVAVVVAAIVGTVPGSNKPANV